MIVLALMLLVTIVLTLIVDHVYKNVAEPLDKELPVTVTSFPSSSRVPSIVGGKGEGLNCSLPPLIGFVFASNPAKWYNPRVFSSAPIEQRFRQACVFHDLCYRHGLATYGYTQNDCDEILQEQAFRICIATNPPRTILSCQSDAKRVAFGVKFGGFKFFKGWANSTYFEFDPSPVHSYRTIAARVVSNPYRDANGVLPAGFPPELILAFDILRSGVSTTCVNCPPDKSLKDLPGHESLPDDVLLNVKSSRYVWLPGETIISAPHLIPVSPGGDQSLVWVNRKSIDETTTCIVAAEARSLLSHNRPKKAGCQGGKGTNERLMLQRVNLYGTSPQPVYLAGSGAGNRPVLGMTALTRQLTVDHRGATSDQCISSNLFDNKDGTRKCKPIRDTDRATFQAYEELFSSIAAYGVNQNFPIVKNGRHILFARSMGIAGKSIAAGGRRGKADGPDRLDVLNFEYANGTGADATQIAMKKLTINTLRVPDDFDPLFALSRDKDDGRVISARVAKGSLSMWEMDINDPNAIPQKVAMTTSEAAREIAVHESWARRPILVSEPMATDSAQKIQLVMSRGTPVPAKGKLVLNHKQDEAVIEIAVMDRPKQKEQAIGSGWTYRSGLSCRVTYKMPTITRGGKTIEVVDTDGIMPCRRTVQAVGTDRATLATRLAGAQMVLGQLTSAPSRPDQLDVALIDVCMPAAPLIISLSNGATSEYPPIDGLERHAACVPLNGTGSLEQEIRP